MSAEVLSQYLVSFLIYVDTGGSPYNYGALIPYPPVLLYITARAPS